MREKIAIVDCGTGNLASVSNAFRRIGAEVAITSKPKDIRQARRIVLPGVGAFGYFMEQLREKNLEGPLLSAIEEKKPYMGICLGMQILFEESEESAGSAGLKIFRGKAMKFRKGKVPQAGWNKILPENNIIEKGYAYFTNSYYCRPADKTIIAAESDYFGKFTCAVRKENVFAVQFHPERSGKYGIELLRRWLEC